MDVEEDASIDGNLMRHLDLMMEKRKSFSDNREQGDRFFIDMDGPMEEEEEEGAMVDSRDRSGRGHRGGKREWCDVVILESMVKYQWN